MKINQRQNEEEVRAQIKKLAELLDAKFQLPFGLRIGWDGILGLIPGIGDFATNAVSFYILYRAAMIGCPPSVVLRMALNVIVDNLLDMIPFIGNIFDFFWKSNLKNVELMDRFLIERKQTVRSSRFVIALTVVCLLALFFGLMTVVFMTLRFLWRTITAF